MSWKGVKQIVNIEAIESWCREMDIENYTINSQGEIDVDGDVSFEGLTHITGLPYKFGTVKGFFSVYGCKKLKSLKNCPNKVGHNFNCTYCKGIESLEGCPKEVGGSFFCAQCGKQFIKEKIRSLCKVNKMVFVK